MANNNFLRNSIGIIIKNIENGIGVSTCECWIDRFANINCQDSILIMKTWPKRKCSVKKKWNIKIPWVKDC